MSRTAIRYSTTPPLLALVALACAERLDATPDPRISAEPCDVAASARLGGEGCHASLVLTPDLLPLAAGQRGDAVVVVELPSGTLRCTWTSFEQRLLREAEAIGARPVAGRRSPGGERLQLSWDAEGLFAVGGAADLLCRPLE